ncbi:MAG: SRPBCC domain-containing protein [Thermoanaerobaculia bacterium]|nr:SRPBCC domain-containing protein [Thermoanaerobaculia bacterium]
MTPDTLPTLGPVRKEIVVRCRLELAFEVFTARIAEWWPLDSHSVGQAQAQTVRLEPRVGGRLYEVCCDGSEHRWGLVTHWDPPSGFDCTWHPGREADQATRVSLRFESADAGTRVRLEHRGWEVLREHAEEVRAGYDGGWATVFEELYAAAANSVA